VDRLRKITMSTLNETFTTNAFGPLLLTQALLPNLTLSPSPRIGNMSSRVGSIADNSSGGSYAYRASKAALNSISKNLAIELREKGIVVVVMHPGLTRTAIDPNIHGMVGVVEPEVAAEKLYEVLMEKEIEDSGKFWHREGYELPW
jgi:NAD(P)-dependent dehydrogenase (short-subunit alcohol dehydrogenase family)